MKCHEQEGILEGKVVGLRNEMGDQRHIGKRKYQIDKISLAFRIAAIRPVCVSSRIISRLYFSSSRRPDGCQPVH